MLRTGNCMYYMKLPPPNCRSCLLFRGYRPAIEFPTVGKWNNPRLLSSRHPWIGAKQQYYNADDQLLQFQTDLHFKYVNELTKYSPQVLPLVGVCQFIAMQAPSANRLLPAASTEAHYILVNQCTPPTQNTYSSLILWGYLLFVLLPPRPRLPVFGSVYSTDI